MGRGWRTDLVLAWARAFMAIAVVTMCLTGCGDDDDYYESKDDFIVSSPSDLEIFIRRSFDGPFDLLEVGVTPFVDPIAGPEPYVFDVSGIAFRSGREIFFAAQDVVRRQFFDPFGEPVVDALIVCDCLVDYVVLRSPFLDVTISFD